VGGVVRVDARSISATMRLFAFSRLGLLNRQSRRAWHAQSTEDGRAGRGQYNASPGTSHAGRAARPGRALPPVRPPTRLRAGRLVGRTSRAWTGRHGGRTWRCSSSHESRSPGTQRALRPSLTRETLAEPCQPPWPPQATRPACGTATLGLRSPGIGDI